MPVLTTVLTYFILPPAKHQFTCADIGVNTVTVTATDDKLNSSSANVLVTVIDGGAPVVATQNINVYLDANGVVTADAQDADNGSYDDCGLDSTWLSPANFNASDLGVNQVSFHALDHGGNVTTGNCIVTVIDTVKPMISSQNVIVHL
ncbi:MAG: hypothetical protein U5L96_17405 [Owenweeksia sp.]|nr:hypothetical protein [Owenweeksia sp.]